MLNRFFAILFFVPWVAFFASSCSPQYRDVGSDGGGSLDGGVDGGAISFDAGPLDSGVSLDSGIEDGGPISSDAGPLDSGVSLDSGIEDGGPISSDAGPLDSGVSLDSGIEDGGPISYDGGPLDSGVSLDAGTSDAGSSDAGPFDAGTASAGQLALLAGSLGPPVIENRGSTDGVGSAARFTYPSAVAVDGAGNVYVADTGNSTIRKVTPAGVVTTVAGTAGMMGSSDGDANTALFNGPAGVAVDGNGVLYVADSGNDTIRKVMPDGSVTTLAGAAGVKGSADGTGSGALFNDPLGVAVDSAGTVYVADSGNDTIREVMPDGSVTTLAGNAAVPAGYQNGTGSEALFTNPCGIAVDGMGVVYVADGSNKYRHETIPYVGATVRKITPVGVVTTLARVGSDYFDFPFGVAVDSAGDVYATDSSASQLKKISPHGAVTLMAGVGALGYCGSTDGPSGSAKFCYPEGVAVDGEGNVYVADTDNSAIRKVAPGGTVTTLAGLAPQPGSAGDIDGTGSQARFWEPLGVAVDRSGNAFVADGSNTLIREVTPEGVTTTIAGEMNSLGPFYSPDGITSAPDGDFYVADTYKGVVDQVAPDGTVVDFAGSSITWNNDGVGTAAGFLEPQGIAADAAGNLYVADTADCSIRKITPGAVVTTFAGQGGQGGSNGVSGSADGVGAAARFNYPVGIAVDGIGNIYVGDTGNHTIRRITPGSAVTTLAGSPGNAGSADGTGLEARFNGPTFLAVDGAGNLYVSDTGNSTVRKVTPDGVVTTVVGVAGSVGVRLGPLPARLNSPAGLALTPQGNLLIVDSAENSIVIASW